MSTLYLISNDYATLMRSIEEQEGEITEEQNELLTINDKELQSKSIAYKEVIDSKESFNKRIDDEIKRLQAIKKRNTTLVSNLKQRLLDAVKLYGEFTSGLLTFTTRKSESVEVWGDTNLLEDEFKTIKLTETPDKAAIKKAIKAGREVKGCELITNLNLSIK